MLTCRAGTGCFDGLLAAIPSIGMAPGRPRYHTNGPLISKQAVVLALGTLAFRAYSVLREHSRLANARASSVISLFLGNVNAFPSFTALSQAPLPCSLTRYPQRNLYFHLFFAGVKIEERQIQLCFESNRRPRKITWLKHCRNLGQETLDPVRGHL